MRKKKNNIPKMKNGFSYSSIQSNMYKYKHFKMIGLLHKTWGGCDKVSTVYGFSGGGGS